MLFFSCKAIYGVAISDYIILEKSNNILLYGGYKHDMNTLTDLYQWNCYSHIFHSE